MDDAFGVIVAVLVVLFSSLITGLASYENGRDAVRGQAVAAGAACYQANSLGKTEFRWGCKH
jgi:hypothetical protein